MLIKNANICQFKQGKFQPVFGNMIIEKGEIKKIIPTSYKKYINQKSKEKEQIKQFDNSAYTEYDADGRILMPPLVNFHEHIYSRLSKGLPIKEDLSNFTNILKNLWWKLDKTLYPEAIKVSAEISAIESIKNGVCTIFDHHSSPNYILGSLNIIKQVLKKRGLNAVLSYEVTDRNGIENMEKGVKENLEFIKFRTTTRFKGQFGLHALFTLSNNTLEYIQSQTKYINTGFHIHVAEDIYDVLFNKQKYNISLLKRMEKYNLLNDKTFLVHGNHLEKEDYNILNNYRLNLVHNPDSNFNNAVGTLNIKNIPDSTNILLGTDGMHSNILKTYKTAFLVFRDINKDSTIGFKIIERIINNSFQVLKLFFDNVPTLCTGDNSDFIVIDYLPYTPIDSDNFISHFIYGIIESQVKTVFKNNYFLMKDFDIENEEKVFYNAYNIGEKIRNNFIKLQ